MKKISIPFFCVCVFIFIFHQLILSQERGVENKILTFVQNGQFSQVKLYDNSYALVIGMSKYRFWDQLKGTIRDTEEVKTVLTEQGFNVQVELDLTGAELENKINQFIKNYGLDGNNRLIIYFAGHGNTLVATDKREVGYIVPIDAPLPETNETEFKRVALSMQKLKSFADEIQTKHALFIFDSCFSGQLLSYRDGQIIPPSIGEYLNNPVRQFITSGSSNQRVPDDSAFRRYFVLGLRGDADLDKDGYITGSELAKYLYKKVTDDSSRRQTPQYGRSQDANLDKGDMVFFLKENDTGLSEEQAWSKAKNENTIQSYTVFLNSYKNGKYFQESINSLIEVSKNIIPTKPSDERQNQQTIVSRNLAPTIKPFEFTTLNITPSGSETEKTKTTNDSFEEDLGGGVKLRLVKIPGGRFKMGSDRTPDEKPIHEVTVQEFYMGTFEITKKQWETVAKFEKVKTLLLKDPFANIVGDNYPVVNITWEDAEEFCHRLYNRTGRLYSLPTEAEWEYAASAGTNTPFFFGPRIKPEIVNFNAGIDSNEGVKGVYRNHLVEVGSLGVANKFGLFDMHGNVAEWCLDGWENTYEKAPIDGTARPGSQTKKVIRGGSYTLIAQRLCSTCRDSQNLDESSEQLGFRVVMRSPIFSKP
jgi:formylglycine-generating enzyme required for sulfatase activity/uncharacterized caspase-like protein